MIAIEVFFILVVLGLLLVFFMQHFNQRKERGEKGDAVKSQEEIKSHQPRH